MFNSIALKVKCPLCSQSLMDFDRKIDGKPGIKLGISIAGKKGLIWLSSIYGSYNYETDISITDREIAEFSCPHCHQPIVSKENCQECNAPLVPFYLIVGGKVSICSRAGCRKHNVEFEDLSTALEMFYNDFAYSGRKVSIVRDESGNISKLEVEEGTRQDKEIIRTGTFLHSYCPHCKNTLIENNMIKFKIARTDGETGYLLLSPYLNIFTTESTVQIPDKTQVNDIRCWHCDTSLIVPDDQCPRCGSHTVKISVAAMSKMVEFFICSQKGCHWHGLSDNDLKQIMLEDSEEW